MVDQLWDRREEWVKLHSFPNLESIRTIVHEIRPAADLTLDTPAARATARRAQSMIEAAMRKIAEAETMLRGLPRVNQ